MDSILADTEVFASLDAGVRRSLARQFESISVPGGTVLIREGEPGDAVWLVVNGRLGVFAASGAAGPLAEIGRGEIVGEVALLSDRPRTSTVRALRDSEVLRLPAAAFRQLVLASPEVLLRLSATLVERLAPPVPIRHRRPNPATIAVLPAGRGDAPDLSAFCKELAGAMARFGSVRLLRRQDIEDALGHRPDGEAVGWLNRLEEDHDCVIYRADPLDSAWTARCLRQADRILLVGQADANPAAGPPESLVAQVLGRPPRCDLVLLHEPGAGPPVNTAVWLDRRSVTAHHHVRTGGSRDYQRLARVLTGRAVGVVLGGGGARGLAHVGVLGALEAAGVPIDAVGGTSVGAIMAAMVAMGWDHETRVANTMATFVKTRFPLGFTFPTIAVSSGRTLTRTLRGSDYFGETAIEDLWTPYFCVSASLSRAETVIHDRGPAWWAIRASAAIPGILPPIWDNGEILVDGGVLDDLPVDVMRDRCGGRVVAVDLRPVPDQRVREPFDAVVSGWRVLGRRLNPFTASPDLPGAVEVVTRAKDLAVRHAQQRLWAHDIDLHLRPPTGAYRSFDFKAGAELIELGYRYASRRLELAAASGGAAVWSS